MYVKLAWRNLWRNKRRTLITVASVFFAVVLSTLMMSVKEGTYAGMIESMVGAYSGYVQVHSNGYWDDQVLDNSLIVHDTLKEAVLKNKWVAGYLERLESFALTASEEISRGAMIVGMDPKDEKRHNAPHQRLVEGVYPDADDEAALVGAGLAEYLRIGVGDTLVMIGMGYRGANAAGKYPVKGIVKFGSPELSNQLVFLPMKQARLLFDMDEMATNLIVLLNNQGDINRVATSLQASLGDHYEVMTWEEMQPELRNMIDTDRVEGYVFMFILYMVVSFGIFGTILMMLAERTHEFGVLVAIGMKRVKLAFVVWMEIVIISIMGALAGMLGAFPVCAYFYFNPIRFGEDLSRMYEEFGLEPVLKASVEPAIFIQQAAIVFGIACVIAIYPFVKITGIKAINAMNS